MRGHSPTLLSTSPAALDSLLLRGTALASVLGRLLHSHRSGSKRDPLPRRKLGELPPNLPLFLLGICPKTMLDAAVDRVPDPNRPTACSDTRPRRSRRQLRVSTRPRIRMPAALQCLPWTPTERGRSA